MNRKPPLCMMLACLLCVPALAGDKKKHPERAMIEKMEAVPCGAKERGITGLGSVFASAGIEHVNSDEKLCPQYLLRTDDMEYHVRPLDHKHPALLPVGKEGEFKLSKDKLEMRIPDGDRKMRHYQVVGMKPLEHSAAPQPEDSKYNPTGANYPNRAAPDKSYSDKNMAKTSAQGNDHPQ
jgi:hypothetical protein